MQMARILIVDDDTAYAAKLAGVIEGVFRVETCHSEADFRARYAPGRYDLLIMDLRLKTDREGLVLLREALAADPLQAAIVMTAYADMETYTDALEAGAMTYLDKAEFSPALIARTVEAIVGQARMRRRVSDLEERIQVAEPLEIIGASPAIRRVREDLRRAAESDASALLIGGPGSGKELVARNIHRLNRRRSAGPFVRAACNRGFREDPTQCLFGLGQGVANSGAADSKGWIEEARGGVLFLDGIEGLDEAAWAAVVSLLDTGRCKHPVNGHKLDADVQVVAASAPDCRRLQKDLATGGKTVWIVLPPLRDHIEDVALLAQYVLQGLFREGRTRVRALRGAALTVLERLPWPGNVRELQSAIAYAAIRADAAGEREIGPEHLPANAGDMSDGASVSLHGYDYLQHLARAELALIESAIENFGAKTKTDLARRLGYNDRFVFARRVRKCLAAYPGLKAEYPRTTEMMGS
jgi:DNA-binding NtrC family response regulator